MRSVTHNRQDLTVGQLLYAGAPRFAIAIVEDANVDDLLGQLLGV